MHQYLGCQEMCLWSYSFRLWSCHCTGAGSTPETSDSRHHVFLDPRLYPSLTIHLILGKLLSLSEVLYGNQELTKPKNYTRDFPKVCSTEYLDNDMSKTLRFVELFLFISLLPVARPANSSKLAASASQVSTTQLLFLSSTEINTVCLGFASPHYSMKPPAGRTLCASLTSSFWAIYWVNLIPFISCFLYSE